MTDTSAGYEKIAEEFISIRHRSTVGVATVREWAKQLPRGASVLDLGCGTGVPISEALMDVGLAVHGVDAAPSMIAAFRARFPTAPIECTAVENARFFGRTYDAVVAWGLMFLLAPEAQSQLIHKVSAALKKGGRFLFTSPRQVSRWPDSLTGHVSVSLGAAAYRHMLEAEGLTLLGESDDEGENHYYFAVKP